VWLTVFIAIKNIFTPVLLDEVAGVFQIAVIHSVFNGLCTLLLLPMAGFLEKMVVRLVPEN
jgi:phosphate:Na+ symporter